MRLKIKETLTITQTVNLINGSTVGIFPTMILDTDPFFSLTYDLCLGYYMERSGDKPISQTFKRLMQLKNQNPTIVKTADEMMGTIIRNKFIAKWSKQYNTLVTEQYNPLNDYEHNETITKDNTDTSTYDTSITVDGNVGTKLTTQFNDTNDDSTYGFNSSSAVPTDKSVSSSSETTQGSSSDNTTHNVETKDGTDTKRYEADETKDITGRRKIVAELIDAELDMRNRQIFFNIIYDDIDSIATLGIYTEDPDIYDPIKEYILIPQTFTENGTFRAIDYGADGFSSVIIDVENDTRPIYNGEVVYE